VSARVQPEDFDLATEVARLRANDARIGAIVTFVGLTRDMSAGEAVTDMWLEHYPGMTEKTLEALVAEARSRWNLLGVRVIHRVGLLRPADQIVLVAVAAAHRGEAFAACEFIIDTLKTRAPFWKRETGPDGRSRWAGRQDSDDRAAARWQ
jgi:molybdopterin synthase catalytic subunit